MMRKWMIGAALAVMAAGGVVAASAAEREGLRGKIAEKLGRGGEGKRVSTGTVAATLSYGSADKQRVNLFRPANGGAGKPLILYVHGGGWSKGSHVMVDNKPDWASAQGLWFGSIGYRLLPEAPVETQAADVGAAIRKARAEAKRFGYDPDRIILMGHSAGAHLAALVATDPQYAGDAFGAIKAVIPIDGACYDVPTQIAAARWMAKRTYIPAFGRDAARQLALSPLTHVGGRDVPRWLLIHVNKRDDAQAQAAALAAKLRGAGAAVSIKGIAGTHMTANVDFGTPGYPAAAEVDAIVRAVVGGG